MSNSVSVSKTIKTTPDKIFDLLCDPRRHSEIDGSGQIKGFVDAPDRLSLGAKFSMDIKLGARYKTTNTVISFKENKEISWKHIGRHVWKYELKENGDGTTTVTETWDWSTCPLPERIGLELAGFPKRNTKNIELTLERLASILENDHS